MRKKCANNAQKFGLNQLIINQNAKNKKNKQKMRRHTKKAPGKPGAL